MAIDMSITLDKRDVKIINQFIKKFPNVVDKATRKAAIKGEGLITKSTPRSSTGGKARRDWRTKKIQAMIYEIFNLQKYVPFLVTGTGLHGPRNRIIQSQKISPRTGRRLMLRWVDRDGNIIFRNFSRGMKKQDMITPNIPKIKKLLLNFITKDIATEWKKRI